MPVTPINMKKTMVHLSPTDRWFTTISKTWWGIQWMSNKKKQSNKLSETEIHWRIVLPTRTLIELDQREEWFGHCRCVKSVQILPPD